MSGFDDDTSFSEEGSFAAFLAVTRQSHAELGSENIAPHVAPPALASPSLGRKSKTGGTTKDAHLSAAEVADADDNDDENGDSLPPPLEAPTHGKDVWPAPHKRRLESAPVVVDPAFRVELESSSLREAARLSVTPPADDPPAPTSSMEESATLDNVVSRLSALESATRARAEELARRRAAAATAAVELGKREQALRAKEQAVWEGESEVAALRAKRAGLLARQRDVGALGSSESGSGGAATITSAVAERSALRDSLKRARTAAAELHSRAETLREQDRAHVQSLRRILGRRGDAARLRELQDQVKQLQEQEDDQLQHQQQAVSSSTGDASHARLTAARAALAAAQARALAAQQQRARSEQALARARAEAEKGAEAARALAGRFEEQNTRLEARLARINEKLARMGL